MTIQELIDKRAGLVQNMRALDTKATAEKRDLTADELTQFAAHEKDFDVTDAEIKRKQKIDNVEAGLRATRDDPGYRAGLDKQTRAKRKSRPCDTEAYTSAFFDVTGPIRSGKPNPKFYDVMSVGVDAEGGYLVPEEFETTIQRLLQNVDPMRRLATVLTTGSDRSIPVQTSGVTFQWLAENGAYPLLTPGLGRVVLTAHKLGGIIPVSEELLQDSFTDIEAFIQMVAVDGIALLEAAAWATGTGVGQPMGLFNTTTAAGVTLGSVTGAVSATAVITPDNLVDVFHALPQYHRQTATWLMSDTMVKLIRKLKTGISGDLTYLWQPSLSAGTPDTILGRPVEVLDYATAPAVSARSIYFGNVKRYWIGDRSGMGMQRLNELYAGNGQVGFKMNKRTDGRLIDGNAMVYFTHGAAA